MGIKETDDSGVFNKVAYMAATPNVLISLLWASLFEYGIYPDVHFLSEFNIKEIRKFTVYCSNTLCSSMFRKK